jgi:hypothetical protein
MKTKYVVEMKCGRDEMWEGVRDSLKSFLPP